MKILIFCFFKELDKRVKRESKMRIEHILQHNQILDYNKSTVKTLVRRDVSFVPSNLRYFIKKFKYSTERFFIWSCKICSRYQINDPTEKGYGWGWKRHQNVERRYFEWNCRSNFVQVRYIFKCDLILLSPTKNSHHLITQ